MQTKNFNVVVLGSQGSGKGTQAELIAREYNLVHFEAGAVLRKLAKEDTELGQRVNEIINIKGEYVPWEIFREILNTAIDDLDPERGMVLDGTPRRMEEVHFWEKKLPQMDRDFDFIFYVKLTPEESIRRLSLRRMCQNNHGLILGKTLPQEGDLCPICGANTFTREDDKPEKVKHRLEWNERILGPVVAHYRSTGELVELDGERSIEEVFADIKAHIKKTCGFSD